MAPRPLLAEGFELDDELPGQFHRDLGRLQKTSSQPLIPAFAAELPAGP